MSYQKTKLNRKKVKYQNILSKSFNISISDAETNMLAICNAGLVNGVTQESIFETFEKYGSIKNIFMIPEKSFSFVEYENLNDAKTAYDNLNNNAIWPELKGPIYLNYVEQLQNSLKTSKIEFSKPPGLIVIDDFITPEEEELILSVIDFNSNDDSKTSELKHRKVKHYGFEFKYSTNNVSLNEPIDPIPLELNFLWERLAKYPNKTDYDFDFNFKPDQLTVNCYNPGQGIPPHVDTHSPFTDGIISLSLQSDIVMDFKNVKNECCNVMLPRRSLCIMSGESRYGWTHGITPRKSDIVPAANDGLTLRYREKRISLTFRKTKEGACSCNFPSYCDSRMKNQNDKDNSVKETDAAKLEEDYVHEVYEKIAPHFSETRHKPWPNVAKFMESFTTGSIVVDVGCGNGKYFSLKTGVHRFEIGCDTSFNLMQVCRERGFECFTCNCLNIPLKDNIADGCISIAVIHHLSTKDRRMKAIEEIIRILRVGGKALIYVWAKNQERQNKKSSYLKQYQKKENDTKETNLKPENIKENVILPIHTNRTNFIHNDLLVPWKLKSKEKPSNDTSPPIFLRYYHVFEDDEIKDMCSTLNSVKIEDYYYDQGNWCILLEKVK